MFLHYIIFILLILNMMSFGLGYIIGSIYNINGVYGSKPKSFLKKEKTNNSQNEIESQPINSSKYVLGIKTDNLEKKYDSLGDISQEKSTINNAVNKLKNMKG